MMTIRSATFLAAVASLLASGLLYHVVASDSAALEAAATRVPLVPMIVGDWHGHDEPADEDAFAKTGAKSYWLRTYVNQKTKASVLVILMCGRPGKMAVHTPEVCYSGAGYDLSDQPSAIQIGDDDQFWTAQFTKKGGHLRLCWAWNSNGVWEAPVSPRWRYRGELFLYKLYVSRENSGSSAARTDATAEFLRQVVPVLQETLFQ